MIVSLKVDVDTYRGMRDGLPAMLEIFRRRHIAATIFVSMGPDHSGRAIRRVITKRGFLKKMFRTKAVSLYGPKTVMYGTLLPGPRIAERNAEVFRRIEREGHEAGVHGWDHVRWQDGLPKFDEPTIARELNKAFAVFTSIVGHAPRACAAPGWIANERSLAVQDRLDLLYCSDVRGEFPFLPTIGDREFMTLQIPTTLPTLDELMGAAEDEPGAAKVGPGAAAVGPGIALDGPGTAKVGGDAAEDRAGAGEGMRSASGGGATARVAGGGGGASAAQVPLAVAGAVRDGGESWINDLLVQEAKRQALARPESPIVHTVHTEVEGISRASLFADLLDRLLAEGASFARLDSIAAQWTPPRVPRRCEVVDGTLPGRSGVLAKQAASPAR
jgi:peptidoglycan/xylan/chitin deacetylase (PgdA/CDA1 family)